MRVLYLGFFAILFSSCVSSKAIGYSDWQTYDLKGDIVYVFTKTEQVMSSPSFFSKKIGTINYGQQVKIVDLSNHWLQIETINESGKASIQQEYIIGWIHKSSITTQQLKPQDTALQLDSNDLVQKSYSASYKLIKLSRGDYAKVALLKVTLRESPSLKSKSQGTLNYAQGVEILEQQDAWVKVKPLLSELGWENSPQGWKKVSNIPTQKGWLIKISLTRDTIQVPPVIDPSELHLRNRYRQLQEESQTLPHPTNQSD